MGTNDEYKDFRCFRLTDDGEREELDADVNNIQELFSSEGVYLFVRNDLRRLFIWKGPKSPVRKRFISSRVGQKIQEETAKFGMHLKIVSVDAGDEPIEFLQTFRLEPYEVQENERLNDMYYIRNEDRRKLEEEALRKKLDSKKKGKGEYWSPILEEQKRQNQIQQSKQEAVKTTHEIATSIGTKTTTTRKPSVEPKIISRSSSSGSGYGSSYGSKQKSSISPEEEKAILDLIMTHEIPEGLERLNIIIGNNLFSPKKSISSVFGKTVESIKWDKVPEIPDGNIDIDTTLLRAYCKNNKVQGMVVFQKKESIESDNSSEKEIKKPPVEKSTPATKSKKSSKKKSTKRTLKKIPQG